MSRHEGQTRAGFTLIELLVVISIITILVAIGFPTMKALVRDTRVHIGANTVAVSITTARAYAVRNINFVIDLDQSNTVSDEGVYSGAAALFTPAGEIRFVENFERAWNPSLGWLERIGQTSGEPVEKELNGFIDLDIDYATLPSDTGVAGIIRDDSGAVPSLITPPFAVWYSQSGYLIVGTADYQKVYYDGDYTNVWDITDGRPANYDPTTYDPNSGLFDPGYWHDGVKKYELPFEKIETVIGVFTYSKQDFDIAATAGSFLWTNGAANQARWNWLKENGEMLLFSRQSGGVMRSDDE